MTLVIKKPSAGKLTCAKLFTQEPYMWLFPAVHGLWHPGLLTTSLWFDAADASTITTTNGAVSQWNDKSGNARHASQGTSGNSPSLASNSLYSLNTVSFDGSNDRLLTSSVSLHSGLYSMFIVARAATPNQIMLACSQDRSLGPSDRNGQYLRTNNSIPESGAFNNSNTAFLATATANITGWNIYSITRDSALLALCANGTVGTTAATTGTPASNNNPFIIGSRESNAGTFNNFWNGNIAEIIFIGSVVSTSTRQKAEGYLAHKWGLTASLPSNHPFNSVGPTP